MERLTRTRAGLLLVLFVLIIVVFAARLYDLQIIESDGTGDNIKTFTTITRVKAARGEILDCNGNKLVTNRASYDLVFNHFVLLSSDGPNQSLKNLTALCREKGIEYVDHCPMTMQAPFTYTLNEYNSAWQGYFQKFLAERAKLDTDVSATLLLSQLRSFYKIPADWSDVDARAVIGIRYELALRQELTNLSNYVFLEDASTEELSAILELNIPGLRTEASTVREYATEYAAHILGYVGAMTQDQWDYYKELDGYEMDAQVGQSGLEQAFEEYLHGVDGYRVDVTAVDGTILEQYYRKDPQTGKEMRPVSGQNVELTIDISLQKAAEDALDRVFTDLRAQEEGANGQDAEGGAAVAIDIKTGKVLVCASYPTYDLSTFFEDYQSILEADYGPLNNRPLQLTYAPGSIYKPAMVVAGIDNGQITATTRVVDRGVYTEYLDQGFAPKCLSYTLSEGTYTHGAICAAESLMFSCNYFFYDLGDHMGQSVMDATVKGFGLGEYTGVELPEKKGYRANPETKKILHTGEDAHWYQADQIMSAIGQSDNQFTPMQMCVYITTLLNQGVRYRATFLNRVVSSDYQNTVVQNSPEIMSTMEVSDAALQACKEGMRAAVTNPMGTAHGVFGTYPRAVGAKTGTAEHGSGGSDNGSFACFAPYDDPQIAIVIFGEKCGGGSLVGSVAREILNVWYSAVNAGDINSNENQVS